MSWLSSGGVSDPFRPASPSTLIRLSVYDIRTNLSSYLLKKQSDTHSGDTIASLIPKMLQRAIRRWISRWFYLCCPTKVSRWHIIPLQLLFRSFLLPTLLYSHFEPQSIRLKIIKCGLTATQFTVRPQSSSYFFGSSGSPYSWAICMWHRIWLHQPEETGYRKKAFAFFPQSSSPSGLTWPHTSATLNLESRPWHGVGDFLYPYHLKARVYICPGKRCWSGVLSPGWPWLRRWPEHCMPSPLKERLKVRFQSHARSRVFNSRKSGKNRPSPF